MEAAVLWKAGRFKTRPSSHRTWKTLRVSHSSHSPRQRRKREEPEEHDRRGGGQFLVAVWGVNFSWPRTPGFPSAPVRTCPALSDPGGPDASGLYDAPDIAFRYREGVGSAFRQLSRLHHPACTLAVYASQLGLLRQTPRKTRFPLTATLGGRGLSPLGLQQEVSTLFCSFTSHRFFLLGTYPGAPRPLPARPLSNL